MTPVPERHLPTEREVLEYLDGRRAGTIRDFRERIGMAIPGFSLADAWNLFFDGMRQMGLLKPDEKA